MTKVLKGNRKKQTFNTAKIRSSIRAAAKEAKLSTARAQRLARSLSIHVAKGLKGKKVVRTSSIKRAILAHLRKEAKPVARAWKRYERKKK